MATVTSVKTLRGSVTWDEAWANRPGSGAGFRWKVVTASGAPAPGVTIVDPTALVTSAIFTNTGRYKAILYASDGAMTVSSEDNGTSPGIEVDDLGSIDIDLGKDPITIPVRVTIPSGSGVFQKLDAVLDVDTTGSMGGTINTAKSRCSEIVNALFTGGRDVRCAVVDFRDEGDAWVSQIRTGLTSSLATIQSAINAMSANGGGDGPEAQWYSIYNACNSLAWRDGSLRVYIQFTDALAHDPRGGVTSAQAVSAITSRNIQVLGIDCSSGGYGTPYVNELVSRTGGKYFALGAGASGIVGAIEDALEAISNSLVVELVADSDAPAGLVKEIRPASCSIGYIDGKYFRDQRPGASFTFDVTFSRDSMTTKVPSGIVRYTFKLLIRENRTMAIIDEVPVKVAVNFDA